MGQFYDSLATGHTTASVALKRLVPVSAKNRFCRAFDAGVRKDLETFIRFTNKVGYQRAIYRIYGTEATPPPHDFFGQ